MDYRKEMGVQSLSRGDGVRIAILDTGTPPRIPGLGWGEMWNEPYSDSPDDCGHATAIASMLFGRGGINGICVNSMPYFVKVLDSEGRGSVKSVVKGIYKALERNVDLINLSLGFMRTEKCPKDLEKACLEACEAGKTIICAAGNDGGHVNWPAALKTTLCIGTADNNGLKSEFSSSGEVDFLAPGVNLPVFDLEGCITRVSGTSFSTALATGLAALAVYWYRSRGIAYSGIEQVRDFLCKIAKDVDVPGWDENTGYGLLDGKGIDPVDLKINSGIFGTIWETVKNFFSKKRS